MSVFSRFAADRPSRWSATLLLTVALAVLLLGPLAAQAQAPIQVAAEYNLKLARLYATAKFVIWPDEANPQGPFVIGVLAPDPFQGGLQKLASRKLKDRSIRVVVFESAQDYQQCHLLFIPADAGRELVDSTMKRIASEPVLVWQDQPDPRRPTGGSCPFILQGDELLIEADPAELTRRGLTPDGRLLSLNMVRVIKSGK